MNTIYWNAFQRVHENVKLLYIFYFFVYLVFIK